MDIKKILQHIDSVEKKKTRLDETASMTVTFNGDTSDDVGNMLDRLRSVGTPSAAPSVGNMHNDISKFKSAVDNMGADMNAGMGTDIVTKLPANAPDEKYAGVDAVTTKAGGGLNGPKNPKDIRVKDPSPYENMDMEEWANEPDPTYTAHTTMLKDLSGGINREKRAYAAAQKGDNAMAVSEKFDPATTAGQIRKMAKGVESSPDERAHLSFAQQVESDLIDLFQYYQQNMDTKNAEAVRGLIRQNKKAQQTPDMSNANNIAEVLYGLMRSAAEDFTVESIKARLYAALSEATKKSKPDFLDMDKDGNKKEPMKKAIKDKKVKEAAKPDFLDMDKDGNKKEPMKKAISDKKKK